MPEPVTMGAGYLIVNQHAKMTPLGGKTALKSDPSQSSKITAKYTAENWGVNSGNHCKNSNQISC